MRGRFAILSSAICWLLACADILGISGLEPRGDGGSAMTGGGGVTGGAGGVAMTGGGGVIGGTGGVAMTGGGGVIGGAGGLGGSGGSGGVPPTGAPTYQWFRCAGSNGSTTFATALSSDGRVAFAGAARANMDFGGGTKTHNNSDDDIFVAEYEADGGNHVSGDIFGANRPDRGYVVRYLAALGGDGGTGGSGSGGAGGAAPSDDLFLAGRLGGTSTVNFGGINLTPSIADGQAFAVRFGPQLTAKDSMMCDGSFADWFRGGDVLENGSPYLTGRLESGFDCPGQDLGESAATQEGFAVRLDPQTLSVDRALKFGVRPSQTNHDNKDDGRAVVAVNDDVYIAGVWQTWGCNNGTGAESRNDGEVGTTGVDSHAGFGARDIVVIALDGDLGTVRWSASFGGLGEDEGLAITADATRVYVAGFFQDTAEFDDGRGDGPTPPSDYCDGGGSGGTGGSGGAGGGGAANTLTSAGGRDVFVLALDATDGTVVWRKRFGGPGRDQANAIAVTPGGELLVAGEFEDGMVFDTQALSNEGGTDMFIFGLTTSGDELWEISMGSTLDDRIRALDVDAQSLVVGGEIGQNFSDLMGEPTCNSQGQAFFARYAWP